MRAIIPYVIVLSGLGLAAGHAQNQPQSLKGVYAPPGMSGLGSSPVRGRRVWGRPASRRRPFPPRTWARSASASGSSCPESPGRGDTLPQDVTATPIPDRPGYGAVTVNGRRVIVNLNTNRIVQTLD